MDMIRRTLKAYVAAICAFVLLTFILAAVIQFTPFRESWSFAGLLVVLSLSTLLLGILEGNIVGKRGLLTGAAAAILFLLVILLAAGGVFAASFQIKNLDPFYLIPVLTGAVGGILGANLGK